jgi:hypothetical protein
MVLKHLTRDNEHEIAVFLIEVLRKYKNSEVDKYIAYEYGDIMPEGIDGGDFFPKPIIVEEVIVDPSAEPTPPHLR